MTVTTVPPAYTGSALCAQSPISLPEPMANRAQSVTRSVIMRWLRGVAERDGNGYAVIAGGGRTVVVLYGEGVPLAAAVIRGQNVSSAVEALETLRDNGSSDFFAMTYPLPDGIPTALSGLFVRPSVREMLDEPRPQLRSLLSEQLDAGFSGSVIVRAREISWATLLLVDGQIIGYYGSDDRTLKATADDASALLHFEHIEVAIHPAFRDGELEGALRTGSNRDLPADRDAEFEHTESVMIELLSELENGISRAEQHNNPTTLARVLATGYERALGLAGDGRSDLLGSAPTHPLLEAHWDSGSGRLNTTGLLQTLEMAAIPDAWLAAGDALTSAVQLAVEKQLTWLSLADEMSSVALQDTLADLLLQARALIRKWRTQRRQVETRLTGKDISGVQSA